ncbi:hypothetical protein B5F36_14800 [Anaerofilum sp. An201]|nr:hypothetical protein B5F36_14800 [Anaerofilum sp. An201]
MFETKYCYPDGTPCEGKLSCTVWSGGKSEDYFKGLPITISRSLLQRNTKRRGFPDRPRGDRPN